MTNKRMKPSRLNATTYVVIVAVFAILAILIWLVLLPLISQGPQ